MTEREFRVIRKEIKKNFLELQEQCKKEQNIVEKFCLIAKIDGLLVADGIVKKIFKRQKQASTQAKTAKR